MSSVPHLVLADPEVTSASRRRVSRSEKVRIIREADACNHGELGALLRREGIYSSTLNSYRKQLASGKLSEETIASRNRARNEHAASLQTLKRKLARSEKKNRQLEALVELQKKVSELFTMTMEPTDP